MKKQLLLILALFFIFTVEIHAQETIGSALYNGNAVIFDGQELDLKGRQLVSITNECSEYASNYMPIRGILEEMGYGVAWAERSKSVIVVSKAYLENSADWVTYESLANRSPDIYNSFYFNEENQTVIASMDSKHQWAIPTVVLDGVVYIQVESVNYLLELKSGGALDDYPEMVFDKALYVDIQELMEIVQVEPGLAVTAGNNAPYELTFGGTPIGGFHLAFTAGKSDYAEKNIIDQYLLAAGLSPVDAYKEKFAVFAPTLTGLVDMGDRYLLTDYPEIYILPQFDTGGIFQLYKNGTYTGEIQVYTHNGGLFIDLNDITVYALVN